MAITIEISSLIKQLIEAALLLEIDTHLTQDLNKNHKNGYATKTMKNEHGEFELDVPRNRDGSFEPEIVKKNFINHIIFYNHHKKILIMVKFS